MSVGSTHIIYSSESRMKSIRAFMHSWVQDLKGVMPVARRLLKRNLTQHYRYSSLGLLWALAPSVITVLVLLVGQRVNMFGPVNGIVPPPFFGVFGLVLIQTFLEAINVMRLIFSSNYSLFKRNNASLEGLIVAMFFEVLINTMIRVFIIVLLFFVFHIRPGLLFAGAFLGLFGVLLIGSGIGLCLAPYNALRKDIQNVMMFLPWILFTITPVFIAVRPGSLVAMVYKYNPLAWIFDSTRTLAYGASGSIWPALVSFPVGAVLFFFGWLGCRFWRPYVVERLLV